MFILIPSALALNGGETWIYHFNECDELRVNITGNLIIHDGEYTIHNDCSETYENYFICNCSNNFDFNVSFKVNAVNNYTFEFNYDYTKEVIEETITTSSSGGGSSGGGGGSSIKWNCEEWNECINGNSTRYCYNNYNAKRKETENCTVEKEMILPIIDKIIEPEAIITEPVTETKVNVTETSPQPTKKMSLTGIIIISIIVIIIVLVVISELINPTKNKKKEG